MLSSMLTPDSLEESFERWASVLRTMIPKAVIIQFPEHANLDVGLDQFTAAAETSSPGGTAQIITGSDST
eukprot:11817478-Heterocapsa_arctica.AAC.1